jgi:uncharacterized membrane protein
MITYEEWREGRRQYFRRNLYWIAPLAVIGGIGAFVGVGYGVAWLWRVTLGDIFGIKPISFWQAWGLVLLCQILFKANMQRTMPPGRVYQRAYERACRRAGESAEPAGQSPIS